MDIMITCYAENAGSIGAGLSDVESVDFDDLSWLYEGASESYWENYRDFEDAVRKAAEKVCSDIRGKEIPHKEELEALAYEAIKVELGEITAVCEIDGQEKSIDHGIDASDLLCSVLVPDIVNEIAKIASRG